MDLFVSNSDRNTLLRNEGAGRFLDVTEEAGVGGQFWSASAAFVDPDGDGDLDLYVTNYIHWSAESELVCYSGSGGRTYCSPKSYEAKAPDEYFENQGDGTFRDVSAEVGLRQVYGNGLGVVCGDFDGDGRPEIFVANDGNPNQHWVLGPQGRFEDQALLRGCAVDDHGSAKAGMGVAVGDTDADGDEDLLIVNLTGEADSFYRNDGEQFADRTPFAGLSLLPRKRTRFGVALRDFDLDGSLDLFEANGRVTHSSDGTGPFQEENLLMRGTPEGRFEEVLPRGGVADPLWATSRAATFGDVDGDGDVDVLVHNKDDRAHLMINIAPRAGSWIALDVQNPSGAPAIGASLLVQAGQRRWRREVRTAESYGAANTPVVHLGLGAASEVSVELTWPNGSRSSAGPLAAGQRHVLRPK